MTPDPTGQPGIVRKLLSYLEIATGIAVLLTTVFIVVLLVRTHAPSEAGPATSAAVGPEVSRPVDQNIEYARADRTLVLALDARCRFCAESSAFYKAIADQIMTTAGRSQVIAVFPNGRADAENFMATHGLTFRFKEMTDLSGMGVGATPTLILVDRSGNILQTWVGKLASVREREIALALNLNETDY